jgi:hypothetical protein
MTPYVKDILLASSDQVAIDAVAATLMGLDPLEQCKYIRIAHEMGLGCGDIREIEIVGDQSAAEERWDFTGPFKKMTFASNMQHKIYWGPLKKPVEWSLKTWMAPWAYIASVMYHDWYWYPRFSKKQMQECLESEWGRLFQNWGEVEGDERGFQVVGDARPGFQRSFWGTLKKGFGILGTCVREAPEVAARRRRKAHQEQG